MEPVECNKCRTAFCKDCIDMWKKDQNKCPMQCEGAQYADLHRIVKARLLEMRFFCPMKECDQNISLAKKLVADGKDPKELGQSYLQAIEHQKTCPFRKHYCPLGCGKKILGSELEGHKMKCAKYEVVCEKCKLNYFPNVDTDKHECMAALKKRIKDN